MRIIQFAIAIILEASMLYGKWLKVLLLPLFLLYMLFTVRASFTYADATAEFLRIDRMDVVMLFPTSANTFATRLKSGKIKHCETKEDKVSSCEEIF